MRATEVAALLANQAEEVAHLLLPNGKRKGHEWECGSLAGEPGESLKVRVAGSKAGQWKDFATDESGDLIGLWVAVERISVWEAVERASKHLGIVQPKVDRPRKVYSLPAREGVQKPTDLALHFLRVTRMISDEAVKAYKVASKNGAIMFPYLRDGQLIAAKYRDVSQKKFWTDAGCEPCLFGWQAVPANARGVVIVEGELDALALYTYGVPALSVPFGGGKGDKQQWIDSEFDRLSAFDEITLAMDNDQAGAEAVAEIVRRLGRERVKVAKLPRKDANECLMDGVPEAEILRCLAGAKTQDPKQLRSAGEYADELVSEFGRVDDVGIRLPWEKSHGLILLRPGELSIWAGMNGHGKSQVAGNITLGALADGHRACVASLEFRPVKWLKRIVRQGLCTGFPEASLVRFSAQWLNGRLWVFDQVGTADIAVIVETFAYAAKRYGVQLFVIDNLAKCGIAEDDYNAQKAIVDRLSDFARDLDIHVALICHTRKTERGEDAPPGKHDVKGTGGITDMAQTVVTVWRNKPKEKTAREGNLDHSKPDCILSCHKQNNGEHEPVLALWFDSRSCQYVEKYGQGPARFIDTPKAVDPMEKIKTIVQATYGPVPEGNDW